MPPLFQPKFLCRQNPESHPSELQCPDMVKGDLMDRRHSPLLLSDRRALRTSGHQELSLSLFLGAAASLSLLASHLSQSPLHGRLAPCIGTAACPALRHELQAPGAPPAGDRLCVSSGRTSSDHIRLFQHWTCCFGLKGCKSFSEGAANGADSETRVLYPCLSVFPLWSPSCSTI